MATFNRDAIWKAADELDGEGKKPTLNAVRKLLGGGSYTTISDAMTEWKQRKLLQSLPVFEPLPAEIADTVADLAGGIWRQARAAAEQGLTEERNRLAEEQASIREQAQEAIELADTLTQDLDQARQQLADADAVRAERDRLAQQMQHHKQTSAAEIHRAAEKAQQKDSEAMEARKNEREALERAARAEGKIEALQAQVAQLTAALGSRGNRPGKGKEVT